MRSWFARKILGKFGQFRNFQRKTFTTWKNLSVRLWPSQPCNIQHNRNPQKHACASEGTPGFGNSTFFFYIFSKQGRFLNFEKEKLYFTTFAPPRKNLYGYLWKNPLMAPSWKKSSDAHGITPKFNCIKNDIPQFHWQIIVFYKFSKNIPKQSPGQKLC